MPAVASTYVLGLFPIALFVLSVLFRKRFLSRSSALWAGFICASVGFFYLDDVGEILLLLLYAGEDAPVILPPEGRLALRFIGFHGGENAPVFLQPEGRLALRLMGLLLLPSFFAFPAITKETKKSRGLGGRVLALAALGPSLLLFPLSVANRIHATETHLVYKPLFSFTERKLPWKKLRGLKIRFQEGRILGLSGPSFEYIEPACLLEFSSGTSYDLWNRRVLGIRVGPDPFPRIKTLIVRLKRRGLLPDSAKTDPIHADLYRAGADLKEAEKTITNLFYIRKIARQGNRIPGKRLPGDSRRVPAPRL